jgi:hypothetical protein
MNKKIAILTIMFLSLGMLATPVLAIGPENEQGNPNAQHMIAFGTNEVTEIWLPSGVMNEWINPPIAHHAGRVQQLDASKAQKPQAIPATSPVTIFAVPENTWVHYTIAQLKTLLTIIGVDPLRADAYPDGVYMRMIHVGW